MPITRPLPWEKSYPPGVVWDAPIEIGTLPALLARAVARFGEKPAFEYREHKISYADFGRRVDAFAAGLMRLGIAKGDRVALYLPNCPAQPTALFAVARIGGIAVNLSPLDAERELVHKLERLRRAHARVDEYRADGGRRPEDQGCRPCRSPDHRRRCRLGAIARDRDDAGARRWRSWLRRCRGRRAAGRMARSRARRRRCCSSTPAAPPGCPRARS